MKKSHISAPAIILIVIAGICGICGRCGKSDTNQTSTPVTSSTPLKTDYPTTEVQQLAKTLTSSPTTSSKKSKSKRSATVISVNANLRKTANQSGEVIELLAENSSLEVIKQKGAWFYVRAGERSGWMHGNTIRLDEAVTQDEVTAKPRTISGASSESADSTYSGSSSEYHTGPRGGCYYYGGTGRKVYVDRSLCGNGASNKLSSSSSNGYIRGPRGGCYYITAGGNKKYVDRSLCN